MQAGHELYETGSPTINNKSSPFSDFRYDNPCFSPKQNDCISEIIESADTVDQLLAENAIQAGRYRTMQRMPAFVNTDTDFNVIPVYSYLLNLSSLLAAEAIVDIEKGNAEKGLSFFADDLNFYHGILSSSDAMLIDKMIALAQIGRLNNAISQLLAANKVNVTHHVETFRKMLAPISMPGAKFADAMNRERIFVLRGMNTALNYDNVFDTYSGDSDTQKEWAMNFLSPFVFKKNITLNLLNRRYEYLADTFRKTPVLYYPFEHDRIEKDYRNKIDSHSIFSKYGLFIWKNYVGDALLEIDETDPFRYLTRAYDITVYTHLVRAQFELKLTRLEHKQADTDTLLQTLGPESLDPYTGQSFNWDEDNNVLWFQPVKGEAHRSVRLN